MRLFLSVNLPESLVQELQIVQSRLDSKTKNIRWIPPKNIHMTLKFIGKYPEPEIHRFYDAFEPILNQVKPFNLELGNFGTFPNQQKPTVLWVGVAKGESVIQNLVHKITVALTDGNLPYDPKTLCSPHHTR